MAQVLNRSLPKEHLWIPNKHMKSCSTWLVIREMKLVKKNLCSHWNSFNYISICGKNIKLHKYLRKQFGSFLIVLIYDGTKFSSLKKQDIYLSQFLRVRNLGASRCADSYFLSGIEDYSSVFWFSLLWLSSQLSICLQF